MLLCIPSLQGNKEDIFITQKHKSKTNAVLNIWLLTCSSLVNAK
jgi:hypothetical protein